MRLVRFNEHDARQEFYINPEDVSYIKRYQGAADAVEITTRDGRSAGRVSGTLESVVEKLSGFDEFLYEPAAARVVASSMSASSMTTSGSLPPSSSTWRL